MENRIWNEQSKSTLVGVVAHEMDCDIIVHEFELQLHYYIYFWTNTLRKSMNPSIFLIMN